MVQNGGVGVLGCSKGCDISLSLSSLTTIDVVLIYITITTIISLDNTGKQINIRFAERS